MSCAGSNIFFEWELHVREYSAYGNGLGVKSIGRSPCRQLLALGIYDQAVRTLNHLMWKTFAEFTHAALIRSPCNACYI
jgi:hypothetical protein